MIYDDIKTVIDMEGKTFRIETDNKGSIEFVNELMNNTFAPPTFTIQKCSTWPRDPEVYLIITSDIARERNGSPDHKWWREHKDCITVEKIENDTVFMKLHKQPVMTDTFMAEMPIKNGTLRIDKSPDPDYPGVDIEYIDKNEKPNIASRPRVLVECPHDTKKLRVLIWANSNSEDYSDCIEFDLPSDKENEE